MAGHAKYPSRQCDWSPVFLSELIVAGRPCGPIYFEGGLENANVLTAVTDLRFSAPFKYTDPVGSEDVRRCPHSLIPESSSCSIDSLASEDELYHLQEDDGAVMRKREDTKTMEELLDSEYGDYGLIKLAIKIVRLLSALPDNQLTSFR